VARFGKTYEALAWLRTNKNPGALGFNILRTTKNVIRLVEGLYEAGAQNVAVTNVNAPNPEEPGMTSDTLLVKPPPTNHNWGQFVIALAALDADEVHLLEGKTGPFFRVWWD
jgi:hypothetical protein